jgi:hypothetical protein
MKISSQSHLSAILQAPHTPLSGIYEAYRIHQKLAVQLKKDLPEAYQNTVHLMVYRAGVLNVGVRTSALKTRLMYEKKELLEHLRQKEAWAGIKDIKINID